MDRLDAYKCHAIVALKNRDSEAQAQALLMQVARQVQPIMRRRQWRVVRLVEFFPRNGHLLGLCVNGGNGEKASEIKLRLRHAHAPGDFMHYESILGTMLHELAHIVRGPHDAVFYKLLDELKAECEELMARGVVGTGQGFDAPSVGRLGVHSFIAQHNPSLNPLDAKGKAQIVKAAEERAKRQRLMSAGPQRLGGNAAHARGLTPQEAAARAAERRARDNMWCPSERLGGLSIREVEEEGGEQGEAAGEAAAAGPSREPEPAAGLGAVSATATGGGAAVQQLASHTAAASRNAPAAASAPISAGADDSAAAGGASVSGQAAWQSGRLSAGTGGAAPGQPASEQARLLELQVQQRWQHQQERQRRQRQVQQRQRAVVDLTGDSSEDGEGEEQGGCCGAGDGGCAGARAGAHAAAPRGAAAGASPPTASQGAATAAAWSCPACTFINRPVALQCDACLQVRPYM